MAAPTMAANPPAPPIRYHPREISVPWASMTLPSAICSKLNFTPQCGQLSPIWVLGGTPLPHPVQNLTPLENCVGGTLTWGKVGWLGSDVATGSGIVGVVGMAGIGDEEIPGGGLPSGRCMPGVGAP